MKVSITNICWTIWFVLYSIHTFSQSQKRVALVIGAQNYSSLPPLRNSINDAKAITATLLKKGFQVRSLLDPKTKREIKDAINWYFEQMNGQVGAVGLIYYAGHGMQYQGDNYIIPTSTILQNPSDLEDYCVKMNTVMAILNSATKSLNILLLDACRSLPSFSRGEGQGLTRMDPPVGSIIVFAAQAGKTASDGNGTNGLFTSQLLKAINQPGLSVSEIFQQVKRDVYADSRQAQLPSVEDNAVGGQFYFSPTLNTGQSNALPEREIIDNPSNAGPYSPEELYSQGIKLKDELDYREALDKFMSAADKGFPKAQFEAANMYLYGTGTEIDLNKAAQLYRKAAIQGHPQAQYNIGNMLEKGQGVEANLPKAIEWYRAAEKKGNNDAASALRRISELEKRNANFGYVEGKTKSVTVGGQLWINKNLNLDHFANGDSIFEARTNEEWIRAGKNKQPAWCSYDNNPTNSSTYGNLYNWYAVADERGLCPTGWHVPSDAEWLVVSDLLGGRAGSQLKAVSFWKGSGNGSDTFGFAGLPSGDREALGKFNGLGRYGPWWSISGSGVGKAWNRGLGHGLDIDTDLEKSKGLSVRCISD